MTQNSVLLDGIGPTSIADLPARFEEIIRDEKEATSRPLMNVRNLKTIITALAKEKKAKPLVCRLFENRRLYPGRYNTIEGRDLVISMREIAYGVSGECKGAVMVSLRDIALNDIGISLENLASFFFVIDDHDLEFRTAEGMEGRGQSRCIQYKFLRQFMKHYDRIRK